MQDIVKINRNDNVAVALRPVSKGETLDVEGRKVAIQEDIPQGHKFALKDIGSGAEAVSYTHLACLALGIEAEPGRFLAMQAILSLAVTAVPLPGSVGASEGSFISLYRPILGGGQVFPVMMLSRGISFYALLAVSGAVTAVLQMNRKKGKISV